MSTSKDLRKQREQLKTWNIVNGDPPGTFIYMGRAFINERMGKYANPYHIRFGVTREQAIEQFTLYANLKIKTGEWDFADLDDVEYGVCWCYPKPCHVDIVSTLHYEMRMKNSE